MCEVSANWALVHGADPGTDHVSTQLELADVKNATLILTASERHKAKVISLRPSAQVRTYTLKQAARIIGWRMEQGAIPPEVSVADRLLWLAEELDTYRGTAPRPAGGSARRFGRSVPAPSDSLADPHEGGKHPEVFASLSKAIDTFCAPLLHAPLFQDPGAEGSSVAGR